MIYYKGECITQVRSLKEVSDFINALPPEDGAVCRHFIRLLIIHGWRLKYPLSEHVEGVYVLRPSGKGGEYRLFYGFIKGVAYIVHSIHKKTQKLNRKDIQMAKARLDAVQRGTYLVC